MADAMHVNVEKGDLLYFDGGMSQAEESVAGNHSEGECLTTRF